MSLRTKIAEMKRLDDLITRGATGELKVLAGKLGASKSTTKRHLHDYKEELGAPIAFNKEEGHYEYTEPFDLEKKLYELIKEC